LDYYNNYSQASAEAKGYDAIMYFPSSISIKTHRNG
jgi:hypothetical protein